jgi:hypothetical protein
VLRAELAEARDMVKELNAAHERIDRLEGENADLRKARTDEFFRVDPALEEQLEKLQRELADTREYVKTLRELRDLGRADLATLSRKTKGD